MKVQNKIKVYEIDGISTSVGEKTELIISNVWNKKNLVELQIGDSSKISVKASELIKAISNSTNNED